MVEGTIEADFDVSINPTVGPPVIRAGTAINDVEFYLNSTGGVIASADGLMFTAQTVIPNNVGFDVPAKGKVTYNFNWKASGTYQFITGTPQA